jgi:DNA-binding transcriptional regulator PaaX
MNWLLLILTLPTSNTATRMRAWRSLKGCGAAVLRDGVYLIPANPANQVVFEEVSRDVITNEGSAYIFATDTGEPGDLSQLFDRREDYLALQTELHQLSTQLASNSLQEAFKQLRKLRKSFTALTAIDFFPNDSQLHMQQALQALEVQINRQLSPNA